ncbi:MAG: MerR family transcriptional regulator [Faecalibacterium sp.]
MKLYSMKEASEQTGLPYETLKFYCNEGLVPNVKRGKNRYRYFDERDIAWLVGLCRLRECGMGIAEMKEYTALCLQGAASIPARQAMLARKKNALLEQRQKLESCLHYLDEKQQFFDAVLRGEIPYASNLLPCSCPAEHPGSAYPEPLSR